MLSKLRNCLGQIFRTMAGMVSSFERIPLPPAEARALVGYTALKQPIYAWEYGAGKTKIALVFGIHGNEVGTVKLGYRFLNHVHKNFKYKNVTLFIIPVLNVDGYNEAKKNPDYWNGGRIGRFNNHSVDLNRNFDTPDFQSESVWSYGKNYSEKTTVFCGTRGNSETETQAITELLLDKKITTVYSFHNAGGDVLAGSSELSRTLARTYAQKAGFKLITDSEWVSMKQTGTFKEWCDSKRINFVEVECKSRWASDFSKQKNVIDSSLQMIDSL